MSFPIGIGFWKQEGGSPCVPVYPAPSLTNVSLWLDATDKCIMWQDSSQNTPVTTDGQDVKYWADKSGNSNDFLTLFPDSAIFSENLFGSLPGVAQQQATNRYQDSGLVENSAAVLMVYRTDIVPSSVAIQYPFGFDTIGTFKDQGIFLGGSAASGRIGCRLRDGGGILNAITSVSVVQDTTYVHAIYKESGNLIQRVNGIEVYNSAVSQNININDPYLLKRGDGVVSQGLQGDLGDVIVMNSSRTVSQILAAESYLITKYI